MRERLAAGQIKGAILPTGSTEQHNEHLHMEHDTASALHVAQQAALGLFPKVVVATPMPVGISEHWMEWPGTLTLRPETFCQVAFDTCESLVRHGIRKILICNGHAGNDLFYKIGFQRSLFRDEALSGDAAHLQEVCHGIAIQAVLITSRYMDLVSLICKLRLPGCQGNDDACVD